MNGKIRITAIHIAINGGTGYRHRTVVSCNDKIHRGRFYFCTTSQFSVYQEIRTINFFGSASADTDVIIIEFRGNIFTSIEINECGASNSNTNRNRITLNSNSIAGNNLIIFYCLCTVYYPAKTFINDYIIVSNTGSVVVTVTESPNTMIIFE